MQTKSKCTECSNLWKSLQRTAQREQSDILEAKAADAKFMKELLKKFKAARDAPRKAGAKIKFCLAEFEGVLAESDWLMLSDGFQR